MRKTGENNMNRAVKILLVEDSIDDAEIVSRELKKGKIFFELYRVDTEEEFRSSLVSFHPDIVLSDFNLPYFNGRAALTIAKSIYPDMPFIIVSGIIGEDAAVELIKSGCNDYLLKDKLGRLPSAVQHALAKAVEHRERLHALNALKESEERFHRVADNTPIMIWKCGVDKFYDYFNKGWLDFTGRTLEEERGFGLANNIHVEDRQQSIDAFISAFDQRVPFEMEYRMRRHDGMYRWVIDRGTPNYLPNKEFIGYMGSCIDIHDRKKTEESLRHTTELLSSFFSQSLDGCIIAMLKEPLAWNSKSDNNKLLETAIDQMYVSQVNDAFARQLHGTKEKIQDVAIRNFYPEHRSEIRKFFLELFNQGKMHYEAPIRRFDGSEIIVEGNAVCIYDNQNCIVGCFGIQRDVTEDVKERVRLEKNEERYRRFFEDNLTGDFITKADGQVITCNPAFAKIFGFSSIDEALTTNMGTYYVEEGMGEKIVDKLLKERKIESNEVTLYRKDKTIFQAVFTALAKFDQQGNLHEIIGYVFDDSRRKDIEKQIFQAQKLESIGTLASGIAHDFNNILNNISGFSYQLLKYYKDPMKVQRYAETINKSSQRGTELASKLLSLARQRKQEFTLLSVEQVVREVSTICHDTFMQTINIRTTIEPELWKVHGDHGSLYQLLLNLCMNARDAIQEHSPEEKGSIHITVRNMLVTDYTLHWFKDPPPTHCVEIIVKDSGPGISSEIRDEIFDPFFTTKKGEKDRGTGLGLTIVYNVVKSHQGAISIQDGENSGAEFHIYLPAIEYSPAKDIQSENEAIQSKNNELILLVDDEEAMRELGKELLEEVGYRVITAENGTEALSVFAEKKDEIALVVLDLVMPDIDGGQVFIEMKKIKKDFKAFFCSGYVPDELISSLLAEEKLRALQKPFQTEQFVQFVYSTLYET